MLLFVITGLLFSGIELIASLGVDLYVQLLIIMSESCNYLNIYDRVLSQR